MQKTYIRQLVLHFCISMCLALCCTAQQNPLGAQAFGTFGGGPELINLGNLDVNWTIPILNKNGRGIPFVYSLTYDSDSVWTPVTSMGTTTWQPQTNWGWPTLNTAVGYVPLPAVQQFSVACNPNKGTSVVYTYRAYSGYVDRRGTLHHASGLSTFTITGDPSCTNGQTNGLATTDDGSDYTISIPYGNAPSIMATITTKAGETFTAPIGGGSPGTWALDSNGNEITFNSATGQFFDTLSSTTAALTVTGNKPSPVSYQYYAPGGSPVSIVLSYAPYYVQTHFLCSSVGDYGSVTPILNYLVDKVTYPDGTYYKFTYEPTTTGSPNVTGRIASVTVPSGGTISYAYTGSNGGINCADGTTLGFKRTTPDSATAWQYSRSGSSPNWTTTVTDPLSNSTTYNFYELTSNTSAGTASLSTYTFYERSRTSGSETIVTCYNVVYSNCSTATVSAPVSQVDKYRTLDSETSATETKYDTANGGRLTEVKEYDFGVSLNSAPPSSALLKDTVISYATLTGITDHPHQITVKDGAGNTKSQVTYTYDVGGTTGTTGTPQHTTPSGARGNPTTISALVTGSATLSKSYSYYDTGNVNVYTDVNGETTTYIYGSGTSCGNSFPTETDFQLNSLKTYTTWDSSCYGAVPVTTKDVNGNPTNYTYGDPYFWRVTSVGYPDGGSTSYTYNTVSTPWDIVTTAKKDGTNNVVSDVVLDGLGRTTHQEVTSDPNGTSYVDTAYDADGRVKSVSNPYYTSGDPTYGSTQYSYDSLGRLSVITNPDNTTVNYSYTGRATMVSDEGRDSGGTHHIGKIFQIDGLGRTLSVCEISGATLMGSNNTPGDCGLDITPATGFLTSYTYDVLNDVLSVSQSGLNSRTYAYDGLGRLTQEVNPESGTTNYSYDATAQKGDLATRTRPKANQTNASVLTTTTYTYDKLHRPTAISYDDGTGGATYGYDEASVSGVTVNNGKGELTHMSGVNSTEIYSYDTMGRRNGGTQCTPLNCGGTPWTLTYTYDYVGDMTSFTNGFEGVTYSYNYDNAARLTKITSSWSDSYHPGTLLTVNTYNALGEVTKETLGNGIVRTLSYDDRGRVQSLSDGSIYSFSLGYAPDSDILTANDSVNGNWTYTYDDFNHLKTSAATSSSFDYTYDRYGNRWQQNLDSGMGGHFSYTFDANNHLGGGFAYDAAGNLTNDTFHSYTYDAEGRLLTVDATAATYQYDPAGRRIRETLGSSTYDYVVDAAGRTISQAGPSLIRSELYAGGMHVASYANSATYFDHSDWLGTVRARSGVGGASVETCISLAFGDSHQCTGADWSPLHFTGKDFESESNLHRFWFREYSTTQGRWMTPDPAGSSVSDVNSPQTWNRYVYVGNNSTTYYDPLGLFRNLCTNAGCILGSGGGSCSYVDPSGQVSVTVDGLDSPCGTINSLLATGSVSSITGLPSTLFTPGGGTCDLHGWVGEETWYECTGNIFGGLGGSNNGLTPRQAAVQHCQQHGQISFNIPFTKIPVTISLSATLGPANFSATNDINAVFPVIPWPEWLAGGASVDVTINAPSEPSSNPNVGLGKNLSVGYFTTPHGAQGLSVSVGPSVGPPINIAVPTNNACGMLVGGKG